MLEVQIGVMSSLASSSSPCALLGRSRERTVREALRIERFGRSSFGGFGHGRVVALLPLGEERNLLRVCSREERSEREESREDAGLWESGKNLASNAVTVGVLALTVAAVAMVSRTRRAGFVASTAESREVYVLNEEQISSPISILSPKNEINGKNSLAMKEMLPSETKSSRSLFFASTTLSNHEGLTKLENKKLDDARQQFEEWLENVKRDAQKEGVSESVLQWALEDVTVSKDSVVKKKTAPEVKLTLDDYLKRMVDERRISIGASRMKENLELLTEISHKFGVPAHFLVAIWGIETNYGSYMGNWDIIQSLATMGFAEDLVAFPHLDDLKDIFKEARRKYFRGELLEALLMLENGTAERGAGPQGQKRLRGSWAGAMGQCQFMPTSFRDYAMDFDGDGRKDIWESKPDVFASIANYIKEHGWKQGGPIFQKVQVPRKLDKSLVGSRVVKSVLDWEHKHGVHLNPGRAPALPPDEMASLLMPNGPKGDAYLVCDNFRVILRYNSSDLYGFAVCELARLIQERASNPFPTPPLSA